MGYGRFKQKKFLSYQPNQPVQFIAFGPGGIFNRSVITDIIKFCIKQ
jgi:hypothetical protein